MHKLISSLVAQTMLALLALFILACHVCTAQDDLEAFLDGVNHTFSHYGNLEMEARWNYITDISEQHETAMVLFNTFL